MAQYIVIETIDQGFPKVNGFHLAITKDEALDLGVRLCREQGSKETDADIRKQLDKDGDYAMSNTAEWAVSIIDLKSA